MQRKSSKQELIEALNKVNEPELARAVQELSTNDLNTVIERLNAEILRARKISDRVVEDFRTFAGRLTMQGVDIMLVSAGLFRFADELMEDVRHAGASTIKPDTRYKEVSHMLEQTGYFQEIIKYIKRGSYGNGSTK